jgi:hypothetical protein
MSRRVFAAVALTALAPLGLLAAQEGDKGLDVKGQIKIGNHTVKMEAGKLYEIRAQGTGFQPVVSIYPGFFRYAPGGPFEKDATTHFYVPTETKDHQLYVTPAIFGRVPEGPLDYTLKVTRVPISSKPLLKQESSLAAGDPPYENKKFFAKRAHHKAFPVKLEADRFYLIDMVRKGKGFDKDIDPYLYLEDSGGQVVAQDDDGGGNLNARIVFKAQRSGDYRIIAASLNDNTGPFTLTVRKQLKEKE